MPTTIFANTMIAAIAAAGVALTSFVGVQPQGAAYGDGALLRLSQPDADANAEKGFIRADRNGDAMLSVDEFASQAIVKAELAQLNGFVAVETGGKVQTIFVPAAERTALSASEHVRIDAVARNAFYAFAGDDGWMSKDDYLRMQNVLFDESDLNSNGALTRRELVIYAQRQARLTAGA